jgi:hypothetical protein
MSWLSRANDRLTERELRTSWRRALVQAGVSALVVAVAAALYFSALGRPWGYGAFFGALIAVTVRVMQRVLVRWEARNGPRNR